MTDPPNNVLHLSPLTRGGGTGEAHPDALRRMIETAVPVAQRRAALLAEITEALQAGDDGAALAMMRRYCGLVPLELAA